MLKKLHKSSKIFCFINDLTWQIWETVYGFDKEVFTEHNKNNRGVYFALNDFEATDDEMALLGKKTKRNICFLKKLVAVYADIDIAKKWDGQTREQKQEKKNTIYEKLLEYCEPTYIIETSNGLQPLRVINEESVAKETQEKYINIINGVIDWSKLHWWAWDHVKDVTRVLRLPWFEHRKEEPFMVQKIHESEKFYTLDQLKTRFWKDPTPPAKHEVFDREVSLSHQYSEVEKIDFQDLIVKAFGSIGRSAYFDKQQRLILDGRLTWTFQGKNGDKQYVATTSHEPYKGNRVTAVADILTINHKEAYRWILDTFRIPTETQLKAKPVRLEHVASETPKNYFTLWLKKLDRAFWMPAGWDLVLLAGFPSMGKTEFNYFVARENSKHCKVLYFALELPEEAMKNRLSMARASIWKYEYQTASYTPHQKQLMDDYRKELDAYKNLEFISYKNNPNVDYLIEEISKNSANLVFVDTMGNLDGPANEIEKLAEITRKLRSYVNQSGKCVFLLHHLNKPKGNELFNAGWLAKFRWTQKIIDDSTLVFEIRRDIDTDNNVPVDKARVEIYQYKDTTCWVTWQQDIYYDKWRYVEEFLMIN